MPFPPDVKAEALIACGRRCCICHKFCGVRVECHHIIPEAQGGANLLENCIPLCFDCHSEVEHYNPKHPKGNKFSPAELRGHRDGWHRKLKDSIIATLAKGETPSGESNGNSGSTQAPAINITGGSFVQVGNANVQGGQPNAEPSEVEIAIMVYLTSSKRTSVTEIALHLAMSATRTRFHLVELQRKRLVWIHTEVLTWHITHEGTRFLIDNNLID